MGESVFGAACEGRRLLLCGDRAGGEGLKETGFVKNHQISSEIGAVLLTDPQKTDIM